MLRNWLHGDFAVCNAGVSSSDMENRRRVRGVKASRQKLEAAMADKGFSTQIQLAKYLADLENLSSPPKDLINKVFREQPVSFHNLTRVAKALGVKVYTLILASDDPSVFTLAKGQSAEQDTGAEKAESDDGDQVKRTEARSRIRRALPWLAFAFVSTAIIVSLIVGLIPQDRGDSTNSTHFASLVPAIGPTRVIVIADLELRGLGAKFVEYTHDKPTINAVLIDDNDATSMSNKAAIEMWDAHVVIRLQHTRAKHYWGITVTLASARHSLVALQEVFHPEAQRARTENIVRTLFKRLNRVLVGKALAPQSIAQPAAFRAYVEGVDRSYTSYNMSHYQRALASIEQARELDPNYGLAYAESCRIKANMSWQGEEATLLERAASDCAKAGALAAPHISVILAKAELLSRLGEKANALAMVQAALVSAPHNADALSLLAELTLQIWSGNESSAVSDENIPRFINRALALSSDNWHAYNTLGNYYFAKGNIEMALKNFKAANQFVKQEVILSNLGIIQLCLDDLAGAKATYGELITHFEHSALGYENLGTVFYYQHNFHTALDYKLRAISKRKAVNIHQVWGDVGDVYWQLQQVDNAINAYQQALLLIDKDELLGNASVSQQVAKAYYKARLKQLGVTQHVFPHFESIVSQLLAHGERLNVKSKTYLAWLAQQFGQTRAAQEIWDALTSTCPVYDRYPLKQ
ncbi:tetratricopeptide repeat protein [Aliiglaciecola sp. 2_MG-2023]|uniref:tetratricopeptide repeat protein n=1 Tax=unclassified Aliiglaciecola TaxID=2593648 RepID=UPI0026E3D957|nr:MULTISPECIES: tetratricopeptide repeat protein [unclassified Aliiglaciecola]MDO6711236.1 tetratricopeptide repeat protein [Aliiglaciecola sp. 2_MG-2023]MDO6752150.1 tetratricopeptide repeat protein [Aliiglaciecola sp. 1_MG-2023]